MPIMLSLPPLPPSPLLFLFALEAWLINEGSGQEAAYPLWLDPKEVPGAPNDRAISSSLKEGGSSREGICSKRTEVGAGREPMMGALGRGMLCENLLDVLLLLFLSLKWPGMFMGPVDKPRVIGMGGVLSGLPLLMAKSIRLRRTW